MGADARFERLARRYVEEYGRHKLVAATQLGDHRSDGELDDVRRRRAAARLEPRPALELGRVDCAALGRANQVDAAILENQLRYARLVRSRRSAMVPGPALYTPAHRPGALWLAGPRVRRARAAAVRHPPSRATATPAGETRANPTRRACSRSTPRRR